MKIESLINDLYEKYQNELSGEISTSLPVEGDRDADAFAISVASVTGEVFNVGQAKELFTIQSISKAFSYALALEQHGNQFLEEKVGVEPTGEDYDSIIKLDENQRPFNPMVNSGAIVISSLINARGCESKEEEVIKCFSNFAGRPLECSEKVFQHESKKSHKNWAIAHLLRHFKVLSSSFREDLNLYFRQCSVEINVDDLALMGATLANRGINPVTKMQCLSEENLRHLLSIIFTCGMYNYSGEWAFDIGLPAKSGISGSILMIVPGLMAIAVYSPRLDRRGNSVRGIKVCEEISEKMKLHILSPQGPSRFAEMT